MGHVRLGVGDQRHRISYTGRRSSTSSQPGPFPLWVWPQPGACRSSEQPEAPSSSCGSGRPCCRVADARQGPWPRVRSRVGSVMTARPGRGPRPGRQGQLAPPCLRPKPWTPRKHSSAGSSASPASTPAWPRPSGWRKLPARALRLNAQAGLPVPQEPGGSKTRALEVIGSLVRRPMHAVHCAAALFQAVGGLDNRPTILFDEIDSVFRTEGQENEELRAFLNAGHRQSGLTFGAGQSATPTRWSASLPSRPLPACRRRARRRHTIRHRQDAPAGGPGGPSSLPVAGPRARSGDRRAVGCRPRLSGHTRDPVPAGVTDRPAVFETAVGGRQKVSGAWRVVRPRRACCFVARPRRIFETFAQPAVAGGPASGLPRAGNGCPGDGPLWRACWVWRIPRGGICAAIRWTRLAWLDACVGYEIPVDQPPRRSHGRQGLS